MDLLLFIKSKTSFLIVCSAMLGALFSFCEAAEDSAQKPNVVIIMIDDLNDFVTGMEGHPQAKTPNITRRAKSGVSFRRAYSNIPACAPSRGSMFSGIYPHQSREIQFGNWFENKMLINSKVIPEYFSENGYRTFGTGKLLGSYKQGIWQQYGFRANYGPAAFNGKDFVGHPSVPEPFRSIGHIDGTYAVLSDVPTIPKSKYAPGYDGWFEQLSWKNRKPFRYVDEHNRDLMPDERCAAWAVEKIDTFSIEKNTKPFFLGVGFIRPHTPLIAPKRFFDMFPLGEIQLPIIKKDDADDTHYERLFSDKRKGPKHYKMLKASYPDIETGLREYVRAYLACVAFVDEQVGKVVDAIDRSPFKDNTIIVLTSDHGYNLGEKDFLFKNSLWEESGRVPLIIRAPGIWRGWWSC